MDKNEEIDMSRIEVDRVVAEQIRCLEGPIELVDSKGQIIGLVRRPPTESEIERAKHRASHGGATLTWEQVEVKLRQETGE
jgi:hypothetical protein